VSGQSYAGLLEKAIFIPLNMHNTGYEDRSSGLSVGYADRGALSAASRVWLPISDGAGRLFSSVEDLFLWDQALYTDRLLPRTELDRMFEPYVRESNYPGFGYGMVGSWEMIGVGLSPLTRGRVRGLRRSSSDILKMG